MRTPIKRPITLTRGFVYLIKKNADVIKPRRRNIGFDCVYYNKIKKDTEAVFSFWGYRTNRAYFRLPNDERHFIVLHWNRNVIKRLRRKTRHE